MISKSNKFCHTVHDYGPIPINFLKLAKEKFRQSRINCRNE